jgi:hypothetical protein
MKDEVEEILDAERERKVDELCKSYALKYNSDCNKNPKCTSTIFDLK